MIEAGVKGHNYITLFMDILKKKTIHISKGKDSKTVEEFAEIIESRNGDRNQIKVSSDMSPAFIKGVGKYLPEAEITFDKFHVMKNLNMAVDEVRRHEVKLHPILINARYALLKNRGTKIF